MNAGYQTHAASISAESGSLQVVARMESADLPLTRHMNETESSTWPILLS
jgi:hypothetical protein